MTDIDIDAIRRLANRATGAPWSLVERKVGDRRILTVIAEGHGDDLDDALVAEIPLDPGDDNINDWRNDAEFIAHARQDIPDLLAKVAELTAELAATNAALTVARTQAATHANEVGRLVAENARVRQQRDEALAVVEAAKALAETVPVSVATYFGTRGEDLINAVRALQNAEATR